MQGRFGCAERDGHAADPENIYLTAGASSGISLIMNVAICPGDGVLYVLLRALLTRSMSLTICRARSSIPIPQYPLCASSFIHLQIALRVLTLLFVIHPDTATIASVEAHPLPYYLNEEKSWSFDESSVAEALQSAKDKNMPVKAVSFP